MDELAAVVFDVEHFATKEGPGINKAHKLGMKVYETSSLWVSGMWFNV